MMSDIKEYTNKIEKGIRIILDRFEFEFNNEKVREQIKETIFVYLEQMKDWEPKHDKEILKMSKLKNLMGERYDKFYQKGLDHTMAGELIGTLEKEDLIMIIGHLATDLEEKKKSFETSLAILGA